MDDGRDGEMTAQPVGRLQGQRTGRQLVAYQGEPAALAQALRDRAGLRAVATRAEARSGDEPEVVLLPRLRAAVVTADPDQLAALGRQADDDGLVTEPERWVWPAAGPLDPELLGYLRGFRDGTAALAAGLLGDEPAAGAAEGAVDERVVTWGLSALGVTASTLTGRGVRVAVLDTGLDLDHPDLGRRAVAAESFVRGQGVADVLGHGTHCAGTVCGPIAPAGGVRYGVAPDVELFVGKVLGDDGRGRDGDVLAGIDWAVEQGCRIVSMSLGSRAFPGEPYSRVFEQVAATLAAGAPGTVLVAAAGNDSDRSRGRVVPVGRPASCPSVVAVAALDRALRIAPFSNAGAATDGGQVDVAAPGVDVLSAYPEPEGPYARLDGTSMATPHVAGVLALLAEAAPEAPVSELVVSLVRNARRLPAPSRDVGAGLVQAPA